MRKTVPVGFTVAKILRVLKHPFLKDVNSASFTVAKILRVLKLKRHLSPVTFVLQ